MLFLFFLLDLSLECSSCNLQQKNHPCCNECKSYIVKCSVCRIGVRGELLFLSLYIYCFIGKNVYNFADQISMPHYLFVGRMAILPAGDYFTG